MDIFTTQLARVVFTPIKPTHLKVRALLKEAASGKLRDDAEPFQQFSDVFISTDDSGQQDTTEPSHRSAEQQTTETKTGPSSVLVKGHAIKHLDIFV